MSKRIIMQNTYPDYIDLNQLEERKYYKFFLLDGTKLKGFISKVNQDFVLHVTDGSSYPLNKEGSFLHPFDMSHVQVSVIKKLKSEWYSW